VSGGPTLSRRQLVASLGGAGLALAAGGAGGFELGRRDDGGRGPAVVPFHGEHQAGIATPAQDRLVFAAFDTPATTKRELREVLRAWTDAAERMTRGLPVGPVEGPLRAPPLDTGEALGLPAARLTITFGLGPGLFDARRGLGLASRRPAALRDLPPLPGEVLDPARSGGDLCVQACADDPQVAFHAVRNLARLTRGATQLRWLQLGFGRTSATTSAQVTPRNLHGFKDGTNNVKADDAAALAEHVWVGRDEPQAWLRGGTYLVCRRIRMLIETWDRSSLDDQQLTIGRFKDSGAPLTGRAEHDPVDLAARDADGQPVIPVDAHIRLASAAENGGVRILRRGYSYTDGIDPRTGELDAGLFFVCFQRDPGRQFAALQRKLGSVDALREYIQHTSSAVFAVPPGVRPGGHVADALFA
jgi:deferrochelatase/peroxidase EfeB